MTPQERTLLRTWLPVVALAELAGFAVPAVVGVLTVASPILVALPALIAAGIVEGAMLGAGQVLVLRHVLPAVSARRWVVATAGGAALAYLLCLLPSATGPLVATWPALVVGVVAAVMGVLLLGSVGTAQWLELRGHVDRAAVWIGVTALAWLLGLGAFLVIAIPLWQPGQAVWVTVLVGLVAGALMALVMATVTGVGLIRLLAGARPGGTPGVPSAPGRPTVVVGIDGSTGSRAALVDAMRSATRRGDRLQVVAVYEPPEWRMPSPPFAVPLPSRVEIETEPRPGRPGHGHRRRLRARRRTPEAPPDRRRRPVGQSRRGARRRGARRGRARGRPPGSRVRRQQPARLGRAGLPAACALSCAGRARRAPGSQPLGSVIVGTFDPALRSG